MPQSSTGPAEAHAYLAVCGHTHLFPGARCRVRGLPDPRAFAADPRPVDLALRFSDDVVTDAELRVEDPAGVVLTVPAYTTVAGTPVDSHQWLIREVLGTGDEVELTVGSRPSACRPRPRPPLLHRAYGHRLPAVPIASGLVRRAVLRARLRDSPVRAAVGCGHDRARGASHPYRAPVGRVRRHGLAQAPARRQPHAVLVLPVLARLLAMTSWSPHTRVSAVRAAAGCRAAAGAAALVWAARRSLMRP
ncbi:hypothetical protein [Streptomyces sp. ITFR-6]|uniref:hypothetical protein n=1 Tax=Streptomyces sp. ITFR-6 TaxID=3075197 RepID=UPI0037D9B544